MDETIASEVSRAQQRREMNGDAVHGNTEPRIAKSPIGLSIRESLERRYTMPNIKGDRPPEDDLV